MRLDDAFKIEEVKVQGKVDGTSEEPKVVNSTALSLKAAFAFGACWDQVSPKDDVDA